MHPLAKTKHYRTPKVNSLFGCVAHLSRGLEENKKSDLTNLIEKSPSVTTSRPNMNEILEDTRDMARFWDL
jgi:hypothetical protein